MKPPFEIKTTLSNDVQDQLSSGCTLFSFLFQHDVYIGERNGEGSDIFSVMVASPDRISELSGEKTYLVLPLVSQSILDKLFDEIVATADLQVLRKALNWEFEYRMK